MVRKGIREFMQLRPAQSVWISPYYLASAQGRVRRVSPLRLFRNPLDPIVPAILQRNPILICSSKTYAPGSHLLGRADLDYCIVACIEIATILFPPVFLGARSRRNRTIKCCN